jgi:hypothetical protein
VVSFTAGLALTIHSAIIGGDLARLPFYMAMMGIPVSNAIDRIRRNGKGDDS